MQPNPEVLHALEDVLQAELAAINTYFVNSKLVNSWGYDRLGQFFYGESIDEMRHAEELVDRIIYFDAVPNLNKLGRVRVGATVREVLEIALELEAAQVARINGAITKARAVEDDGTRVLLEPLVTAGEHSIDWLETQLVAIDQLGEQLYLSQHLNAEPPNEG